MPSHRLSIGVLALAATALTPCLATVHAAAAGASGAVVFLDDSDNADGLYGIDAAPSGDLQDVHPVLATGGMVDVLAAKVSPDGQRVAALVDRTAGSSSDNGDYNLEVMNLDGSAHHVVASATTTDTGLTEIDGFSWVASTSLVFGYTHSEVDPTTFNQTTTRELREVAASGGTVTSLPNSAGLADPAVSPDGSTVAAMYLDPDAPRGDVTLRTYNLGTQTLDSGTLDTGAFAEPTWSPDGNAIAYVKDTSTNSTFRSAIEVVRRTSSTDPWSAPADLIATDAAMFDENPSFAPDGTLWLDRVDTASDTPKQELWTAASDGTGLALALSLPDGDAADPTVGAADTTAPAAPTLLPAVLGGATTRLAWTVAAGDSDYLYAVVSRTGGTSGDQTFTTSGTSYADTTTVVGQTYTYTVTAVDAAGNQSAPSAPQQVTALAVPHIVVATPTSSVSHTLAFPVSWAGAGNPAGTTYHVQEAVAGGSISSPASTTSTSGSVTGVAGRTYTFRAQAVDAFGNVTPYTVWTSATVPFDQTAGHFSKGWTTVRSSALWLGSAAATIVNGATVTFTVTSSGVQVIGDKLPAGASFKVYVGSSYKGSFSTKATTTLHRQVLWRGSLGSVATRAVKLVAVVAKGKTLHIDGLAAPR